MGVTISTRSATTPKHHENTHSKRFELSGLRNANAKRRVFWTQATWTQALALREVFKSQKTIAMRFLNASVLERKALNRNLSWGFPLGNLLPKTRVLKHRVLERKRRPNANASVLGTQRFRTLRIGRGFWVGGTTTREHLRCSQQRRAYHACCDDAWIIESAVVLQRMV